MRRRMMLIARTSALLTARGPHLGAVSGGVWGSETLLQTVLCGVRRGHDANPFLSGVLTQKVLRQHPLCLMLLAFLCQGAPTHIYATRHLPL